MGKYGKGLVLGLSSLIVFVLYHALMIGLATGAAVILKHWALPTYLFLKHWALPVYLLWVVAGTVGGLLFGSYLFGPPGSGRLFTFDPARFERPFWKWVRRWGIGPLVLLVTLVVSSIVAALLIRSLGINGRRAWVIALVIDAIVAVVIVLLYLGGRSLF
jgi:hypothetical protein